MSKALVKRILSAREEVTTSADGRWHGWTETELRLAEYAAELRAENARLTAELAAAREERDSLAILANALWPVLEGMYGCDGPQDNLPIELIPEDLRQLFHKLLEVAGERT